MNQNSFELRIGLLKQLFLYASEGLYLGPVTLKDSPQLGIFGVQLHADAPRQFIEEALSLNDGSVGANASQVAIQFVGIKELLALRREMLITPDPCADSTICFIDSLVLGPVPAGYPASAKMN